MNTDTKNKTTTAEANQPQATTNEEILTLLRKLVEQNATNKSNVSNQGDTQDDTSAEIKRLLAELLKKKNQPTNNAPVTQTENNDLDELEADDNEPNDSDDDSEIIIADPDSDLETLGFIAGGAALVGLGALLYHCLKD